MRYLLFAITLICAACTEAVPTSDKARILMMGDSLLATHQLTGRSIGHALERELKTEVTDRSVTGARMIYALPISGSMGLRISAQYRAAPWDWVIINGGGNDLWLGCGCGRCERRMTRMISADGKSGEIPALVQRARQSGAQVIYLGYLRSPGLGSPIEHCKNEAEAFEGRLSVMAARDKGVHFLSIADLVPHGDRSYHAIDMIHPSPKASRAIAGRLAAVIRKGEQ